MMPDDMTNNGGPGKGLDIKMLAARLSFVIAFLLTLPKPLKLSSSGLDPSWITGLYMAALEHLSFGKDIIFTYGPLGFLAEPAPVDHTLWAISLLFNLLVYALFFICIYYLLRRASAKWYHYVALAPLLVLAIPAVDFLLPLAISIALYLVVMDDKPGVKDWACLTGISFLCAVGTLMKFNMAIVFGAVIIISFVAFWANKKSLKYGAFLFVSYFIFLILSWIAVGQRPALLIDYVLYGIDISKGYSAMALGGFWYQSITLLLFVVAILALLAIAAYSMAEKRKDISIFLLINVPLLFSAYKYGFVRNDLHVELFLQIYALIFGLLTFILITGLKKGKSDRYGKLCAVACLVMVAVLVMPNAYLMLKSDGYSFQSPGAYVQAANVLADNGAFNALVESQKSDVRESASLDARTIGYIGNSPIDVFPWDISLAWAYGMNWSPRPIFQSYSAYTSKLDLANSGHFTSDARPRMVLFSLKSVDGRYPIFDEPATFRALLCNYTYYDSSGKFVLLEETSNTPEYNETVSLGNVSAEMGRYVEVPKSEGPVFARIYVDPSLYGQAVDLLYKPSAMHIRFKLTNGSYSPEYRFIPAQAVDGVFLSRYAETTEDLAAVFKGNMSGDIESIMISTDGPADYSKSIRIEFFGMR